MRIVQRVIHLHRRAEHSLIARFRIITFCTVYTIYYINPRVVSFITHAVTITHAALWYISKYGHGKIYNVHTVCTNKIYKFTCFPVYWAFQRKLFTIYGGLGAFLCSNECGREEKEYTAVHTRVINANFLLHILRSYAPMYHLFYTHTVKWDPRGILPSQGDEIQAQSLFQAIILSKSSLISRSDPLLNVPMSLPAPGSVSVFCESLCFSSLDPGCRLSFTLL